MRTLLKKIVSPKPDQSELWKLHKILYILQSENYKIFFEFSPYIPILN